MTNEELQKVVSEEFENAERAMSEMGKMLPTLVIGFKHEGEIKKMGIVLGDDKTMDNRFKLVRGAGFVMGTLKKNERIDSMEFVTLSSEAWMATQSLEDAKKNGLMQASKDPKRLEVLISSGRSIDGDSVIQAKQINSMEIKGKRVFSLTDLSQDFGSKKEQESELFDQFYKGYENSKNDTSAIPMPKDFCNGDLGQIIGTLMGNMIKATSESQDFVMVGGKKN